MRKAWQEHAKDYAKATGKCVGNCPAFGLPDQVCSESEFRQSIASLSTHSVHTCNCWGEPIPMKIEAPPILTPEDQVMTKAEELVRLRLLNYKTQMRMLVDKISINNFRLVDGKVTWDLHIPPTLLTLVTQLPKDLTPPK